MPKGPKYVDFVITPRTTAEDLCGFLVRADMAAAGHPFNAPGCSSAGVGAPITEEVSIFSPQSLEVSRHEAFGATDVPSSALESASQKTPSSPLSRNTVAPRQVVVVCLHGIADASATVQSALMDLLMFEQVQSHNRAVRTQALRIVAFCSSRNYAILLPEPLRALFTLSTYVSTLASDSAVVLQMASASSSNIVNKRFMIEVMTAPDGQALLKTVTLSSFVKRYLLHLLLVLRGSSVMGMSPGALALRRIPRWVTLLKALAILFMPDEELLRSRAPQTRSALLQTYTRTTMSATFERAAHLATQRAATTVPSTTLPERRAAQQEVGESQSVEAAGGLRQVDPSATSTEERSNTPQNGGGGGGKVAIESFSNVVVSPSDVACVLHCLVGHLITMPREVVPLEETVPSTGAMLGNTPGTGTLADAHWGMLDVHRHGNMEFSLQDPAMWDAVVASWPLRNLRGIANPALDIPMGGSSSTQYGNTPLDSVDNPEATGEVDWSLQRGNGALSGNCLEQDSRATPSPKTHEQYFQTLNSRTFFSVLEAWKWTAQNKFGVLDVSTTPMLDYCEVRETRYHMSMFSPYDAVYGHDTTYIRRMTVEEYVQELKEEEADARGETPPPRAPGKASENTAPATPTSQPPARRTTREYEQRRMALSSCNPNVVFFSKYPMYDRLGRELCVAFQMQDMAVQQELRSLETEESRANGLGSRRSGVRLSAELPMESDTTGSNCPLSVRASAAMTEKHELAHTEASRLVRPSHMDGDTLVDIDVSATTYRPSSATIGAFSRPVSGRPSDFSIFCDSSETAAAEIKRGGLGKVRSSVPVRSAAQKEGILIHRRDSDGGLLRATSLPPAVLPRLPADADDRHSQRRWWSEKRHRTRNSGGGGRHSRVRFVNDTDDIEQEEEPPRQCARGAVPLPLRLLTPPPVPMSEAESTRVEETAVEDATRWTTASRASAAVRATKQLFRCTAHTNTSTASRATITPSYRHPIESSIYGLSATAIAASKVRAALESNVQVCAAAMSPHLYSEEEATSAETTPELQCGSVVQLGSVWYRLVHFHLVAEVYVAERIRPQVRMTAASPITKEQPREAGSPAVVGAAATAALSETAPDHRPVDNSCMLGAVENTAPKQGCSVASAVPEERLVQTSCGGGEGNGAVVASTANECVGETSSQQFFVYRWRSTNLARGADEARRAALGLSLFAPQLHVHSLRYADGGGITVLSMPPGYRAVPMSGLPLSLRSYTTLLRLLLKALSVMVARRTVHGNLSALGELFLAWPVTPEQSSSLPRTEEGKQRNDNGSGNGNGVQGAAREPLILLFHWERWVDFSMFVDRNAGRTVPFDFEDDTAASLTTYGKDVLGSLQLFLEHPLAAELTSEQYILLQKLIVMATEPTQVANLLIQMNNLMLALPIDTAALHQSFDASVMHHAR